MPFLRANDIVLHYEDRGEAGPPVLVFANSLGTDFRIWNNVAARFADSHRIVRYDKRGHGLSEATPSPYQLTDHVQDLAALLDHLATGPATIVGVSVGGMIAQGLAALRPELVERLVLCDTGHRIGDEESWNQRIALINDGGIAAMADAILERWFTPGFRTPDNPAFEGYRAMLTRTTRDGYLGTCHALRDADLTESTRALTVPVLCLVGEQDGSTPPDLVRSMADLITGSRFEIIANSGHIPSIEQPAETARLIAAFLNDTAS